jgi:protein phosphatase PTC7
MVGVADGVGAWNTKENGRPGLWARLLMHYWALECEERVKLWKVSRAGSKAGFVGQEEEKVDIVAMLQRAYLRTVCDIDTCGRWVGSTTACVGLLHRSTLHIANVLTR